MKQTIYRMVTIFLVIQLILLGGMTSKVVGKESPEPSPINVEDYRILSRTGIEFDSSLSIQDGLIGVGVEDFYQHTTELQVDPALYGDYESATKALDHYESYTLQLLEQASLSNIVQKEQPILRGINQIDISSNSVGTLKFSNGEVISAVNEYVIIFLGSVEFGSDFEIVMEDGIFSDELVWLVEGSVSFASGLHFYGSLIASGSITLGENTSIEGKIVSLHDKIVLAGSNVVTRVDKERLETESPLLTETPLQETGTPEKTENPSEESLMPEPTEILPEVPLLPENLDPTETSIEEEVLPIETPESDQTVDLTTPPAPSQEWSELDLPTEPVLIEDPESNALAPLYDNGGDAVPDEYLVVLKSGYQTESVLADYTNALNSGIFNVMETYSSALKGFAASVDESGLTIIRQDPRVEFVEPNYIFSIAQEGIYINDDGDYSIEAIQNNPTWGLDRIDQRSLPLNSRYTYDKTASGVHVYIIDTGINPNHVEFTNRIGNGYDAIKDGNGTGDCHSHGTHVAGTVGGTQWGVAKAVTLHPVRVLACDGFGTGAQVVAGIDWVAANRVLPAVANMSLGSLASTATDTAVQNLINRGVTVVAAAMNETEDACNYSPARVPAVITVAATDRSDTIASFSNYGSCVDIFAPGVDIRSASYSDNNGSIIMDGTSMASPHVAGAAAIFVKANTGATPATVAKFLIGNSSLNRVTNPKGSPNRLLYSRLPVPQQISPSAVSGNPQPAYHWRAVTNATRYEIQVTSNGSLVYAKNFPAEPCPNGDCGKVFFNILPFGNYSWRIRAYVGGGWMLFSPWLNFTVSRFVPRGMTPTGTIYDETPEFRWTKVDTASRYMVQLVQNGKAIFTKTVSSSYCGSIQCALSFKDPIAVGNYTWRVKAYARDMWNPYSAYTSFRLVQPIPTPVSPSGSISDRSPQYAWTHIPGTTRYQLQLTKNGVQVYLKVFDAKTTVCNGTRCTIRFFNQLSTGSYVWRVKAYYENAWQLYSPGRAFTIN